jgi:hypothetical protein
MMRLRWVIKPPQNGGMAPPFPHREKESILIEDRVAHDAPPASAAKGLILRDHVRVSPLSAMTRD